MHKDKYVFAQLASFLDRNKFNYIIRKYNGDKYVKYFTCWNQLLSLMFGQLSNRESLRDLIVALDAHHSKSYHLGLGKNVSKSSLARANKNRDYHIFQEYAYYLVNEARQKRVSDIFKLGGNVYAFDSTTINLCLSVFWWAKFRTKKGGIKVHTLYDVETQIPAFFHITEVADRSLAIVDFALRRRFAFVDLEPTFGHVWRTWVNEKSGVSLEFLTQIETRLMKLNKEIEDDSNLGSQFKIGHSYVTTKETVVDEVKWFEDVVNTEIGPLLDEYWFDDRERAKRCKNELMEGL